MNKVVFTVLLFYTVVIVEVIVKLFCDGVMDSFLCSKLTHKVCVFIYLFIFTIWHAVAQITSIQLYTSLCCLKCDC